MTIKYLNKSFYSILDCSLLKYAITVLLKPPCGDFALKGGLEILK